MRINRFLALATGISRRAADKLIAEGSLVTINGSTASTGYTVTAEDVVVYQSKTYTLAQLQNPGVVTTVLFNKPAGYIVSRDGQGSDTIYDILPTKYHHLKPVGRLDKYSSGLLLLTNDGDLANRLTHPRHQKVKIYEVSLSKPLAPLHRQMIQDHGVLLDDGPSKFELERIDLKTVADAKLTNKAANAPDTRWRITMHQGRNRQIRRTFLALGYGVSRLHRTQFDEYPLGDLKPKMIKHVT